MGSLPQQEEEVYDVLIIGAGPCGLATAARLCEPAPDAIFTDAEAQRFNWIKRHRKQVSLKNSRNGKTKRANGQRPDYKMLVLDASATDCQWLGRWKKLFNAFGIINLRSHMLWHVDPQDRDALLAYAHFNEREKECLEIPHCVGREISKHAKKQKMKGNKATGNKQSARIHINERDKNDYYNPSQALFVDHCHAVAERYRLGDMVRHETAQEIDYGIVRGVSVDDEKLFTVITNSTRRYAKTVVLAVGPGNAPKIPEIPSMPTSRPLPQACHSMQIERYPDPVLQSKIDAGRATSVLIVGGGLTSAQLADLAVRHGVTKTWLIMRGPLRIKHFDVSLEWMGKWKVAEQSRFWLADSDEEKMAIVKEAREGGSLTGVYHKKIKEHRKQGRLEWREETRLVDARFEGNEGSGSWIVQTEPPIENLPAFDHICFATGIQTDFSTLPYLQTMISKYPVKSVGGFPCVTESLMWRDDVPMFLAGRLGMTQLGPAAPNIGGARLGAERIAWAIQDTVKPSGAEEWDEQEQEHEALNEYASGTGNMYNALSLIAVE